MDKGQGKGKGGQGAQNLAKLSIQEAISRAMAERSRRTGIRKNFE